MNEQLQEFYEPECLPSLEKVARWNHLGPLIQGRLELRRGRCGSPGGGSLRRAECETGASGVAEAP